MLVRARVYDFYKPSSTPFRAARAAMDKGKGAVYAIDTRGTGRRESRVVYTGEPPTRPVSRLAELK